MKLNIRIDSGSHKLGPGKIRLLMAIDKHVSIAAAAREASLSYGKAMRLIKELDAMFNTPLLVRYSGGAKRGGARLTEEGYKVIELYNVIIETSECASQDFLLALDAYSS